MTLAQDISKELDKAIASASGEVHIVQEFIKNLKSLKTPPNITITTGVCHQKPYAHFINPNTYHNHKKCELGDILWAYKVTSSRGVIEHRAIFSQAKHSRSQTFKIEPHQYQFLTDIGWNSFNFGKSVTAAAGYQPIVYTAISKSNHFSNYLFLNPGQPPKCETTSDLSLANNHSIDVAGFQIFERYIESFLRPNSFGMSLLPVGSPRWIMIDIVFKRLSLKLDPPEEWRDHFEDSKSAFGAILIEERQE